MVSPPSPSPPARSERDLPGHSSRFRLARRLGGDQFSIDAAGCEKGGLAAGWFLTRTSLNNTASNPLDRYVSQTVGQRHSPQQARQRRGLLRADRDEAATRHTAMGSDWADREELCRPLPRRHRGQVGRTTTTRASADHPLRRGSPRSCAPTASAAARCPGFCILPS